MNLPKGSLPLNLYPGLVPGSFFELCPGMLVSTFDSNREDDEDPPNNVVINTSKNGSRKPLPKAYMGLPIPEICHGLYSFMISIV